MYDVPDCAEDDAVFGGGREDAEHYALGVCYAHQLLLLFNLGLLIDGLLFLLASSSEFHSALFITLFDMSGFSARRACPKQVFAESIAS